MLVYRWVTHPQMTSQHGLYHPQVAEPMFTTSNPPTTTTYLWGAGNTNMAVATCYFLHIAVHDMGHVYMHMCVIYIYIIYNTYNNYNIYVSTATAADSPIILNCTCVCHSWLSANIKDWDSVPSGGKWLLGKWFSSWTWWFSIANS